MLSRRAFLDVVGTGLVGAGLASPLSAAVPGPRKKLAIVTTVWRYLSHAQHMGDRFLVGYPTNGRWHDPRLDSSDLLRAPGAQATAVGAGSACADEPEEALGATVSMSPHGVTQRQRGHTEAV